MYINEQFGIALGTTDTEAQAALNKAAAELEKASTPAERSKWEKVLDFGKGMLDNYYRGKISKEQLAAQQAQMQMMMQQQAGAQRYLPYIAIGGIGLLAIIMLRRR